MAKQNLRRKQKTLASSIERELGANDKVGLSEKEVQENDAIFHRRAQTATSLTPEILNMMDKEEELTDNQMQREAEVTFPPSPSSK